MDNLKKPQSTAPYQPLADTSGDTELPTRKSWRGRKVSAEDRLMDAVQGPAETTRGSLKRRLQERYGSSIAQKVIGKIEKLSPETKLADRRVAALEEKARKLLVNYQASNRKHLKSWIKNETSAGLVAKQFEQVTGYRWDTIPAHERRFMVDQVRLVLAQSQEKLTKKHASYLAGEYLQQHQSMFTQFCPKTSQMLEDLTDLDPPILGGHLKVWASEEKDNPDGGLTDNDLQIIQNFQYLNHHAMAIASSSSLEDTKSVSYHKQLESVKKLNLMLVQCMSDIKTYADKLPPELTEAMVGDLKHNLAIMNDCQQQLRVNAESDPRRAKQWQQLRLTELKAGRELLSDELGMYNELAKMSKGLSKSQAKQAKKIKDSLADLDEKIKAVAEGTDETRFPREETRRYQKHVENLIKKAGFSGSEAVKKMKYYRTRQLTHQPWKPIVKTMVVKVNRQSHECESTITPAACLKLNLTDQPDGDHDVFPVQYKGTGRPSINNKESQHAVNLNESRLMVDDEEGFRGLRSATICAYGIKDDGARWQANVARARELLIAAVRMQIDRSPESKEAAINGDSVSVKLFSTSLLSPDQLRHVTHIHDDELNMQEEQVQALEHVVREIQDKGSVVLTDSNGEECEIEVDLDLVTCNFGVNQISLNPIKRRLMDSWSATRQENLEGLQKLIGNTDPGEAIGGWVGEYLDEHELADEEKIIIVELVEQIRQMYTSGSYKKEGNDAYDMVERLQYLAYKIDAIPHFNCKSGKDRTGEADAAIKRFATQVAVNGYVPDPDLPVSREEQILVQQFVHGSGNIELQQQNLNKPGYKTGVGKAVLGDYVYNITHKPDFTGEADLPNIDDEIQTH